MLASLARRNGILTCHLRQGRSPPKSAEYKFKLVLFRSKIAGVPGSGADSKKRGSRRICLDARSPFQDSATLRRRLGR